MSDERKVCKSCRVIEFDTVPIGGEWLCCDCLSKTDAMDEIVELNKQLAAAEAANKEAFIAGLREYAWWKDGVQYVGSCGTTLEEAIRRVRCGA